MKVRGSGSGAPSSRSRDARKSISSCFSAGESPAAADSISASVTIQASVHRTEVARQGNSGTPRVPEEASFRDHRVRPPAASSEEARASDAASSSAPMLLVPAENHFVLDPTRGAFFAGCRAGRMEPHRAAFIKRYWQRHPATKARSRPESLVPSRWPSSHSSATPRRRRRSRPFREDRGGSHSLAPNLPAGAPPE